MLWPLTNDGIAEEYVAHKYVAEKIEIPEAEHCGTVVLKQQTPGGSDT